MNNRSILGAAMLATGLCMTLPSASALAADSSADAAGDSTQSHYSDQQLKQFVSAQDNVQQTFQTFNKKIAAADDDEAKKKLKTDEAKALVKAVKDSGLKPDTYNAIAKQAQNDPELTQRIQSFMTPQ